jgi:hypothetical protein
VLQQGAIAAAGGGYSEKAFDYLDHKSALALRVASSDCRDVVKRSWHAHEIAPGRYLAAALSCFDALRALSMDKALVRCSRK